MRVSDISEKKNSGVLYRISRVLQEKKKRFHIFGDIKFSHNRQGLKVYFISILVRLALRTQFTS